MELMGIDGYSTLRSRELADKVNEVLFDFKA
jgi:hypothetical protein